MIFFSSTWLICENSTWVWCSSGWPSHRSSSMMHFHMPWRFSRDLACSKRW